MSEMTAFTLEGDVELQHNTEEGNRVLIDGDSLDGVIASNLGFPSEEEWDEMFERMQALREQGLQPLEGEPDIVRQGPRLRISVEVVS